ncbi:ATP-dependent protease [Actibacterium mucosum KCTC 23349]|uniref:ATP-dependent protease n=1 Tax=Actibacterium mucosum KCTC 23349 TaxID=1454373 RepID=A0A037ZPL7_9RHOB|nr:LON peptidase substrate-binding domain-containing protein [Actibacterium mucosum]KAJ57473.1 ATP-dependent protease [Actibacterium mucosum KCTC 23349]
MFTSADLPQTIPVFPLPGALLLPRGRLPLQIFEPRYLAMLDDTLKTSHRLIGMIQPLGRDGDALHKVGCAGRVTGFNETDDGRYMISLTGVSRFQVLQEEPGFTPYRRAQVAWDGFARDLGGPEHDDGFDRPVFLALLSKYFNETGLSTDWDSLKEADEELMINALSMMCPFEPEDKQALLQAATLAERRKTMTTLIEFALLAGGDKEVLQ